MPDFDVLIIGAGHGGAQAAIALRQRGFEGPIGLVGAEPDLPYERPPLSKDYLAGEIILRQWGALVGKVWLGPDQPDRAFEAALAKRDRGLGAAMAGADDQDVEIGHHLSLLRTPGLKAANLPKGQAGKVDWARRRDRSLQLGI